MTTLAIAELVGLPAASAKVISRVPRSRILADIRQEAAAMERVKGCSGVAQLVDCREDTQYVYLLTELCKGGDLRRYVEVRLGQGATTQLQRLHPHELWPPCPSKPAQVP